MNYTKKLILLLCLVVSSTPTKWEFPRDFKFGAATSAYQIEGGWNASGKGLSAWDVITHTQPSIIADGSTGDVACDSYHKWEDDIEILANTSVDYYRFSLSWTRLLPHGFAYGLNQAGVDYYNNLIDGLLAKGIEPLVTLFHWDLPYTFTYFGGFYSETFVELLTNYARVAFQLFGDRVKTWITLNEPKVFCVDFSQLEGLLNQVYPNGIIEYLCSYYVVKAHAAVYRLYNTNFRFSQKGKVGITLNYEWAEPATNSPQDIEAAEQRRQFEFGLYANPVVYGDWPKIVIDRVANRSKLEGFPQSRLPQFSLAEKLFIRGSYDFIGLNNYNTWLVAAAPEAPIGQPSYQADEGTTEFVDPNWPNTGNGGKVVPWGIRHALKWMKLTYNNPEILITECGYPDQTGALEDDDRISFLQQYINETLKALLEDKVKVRTFTVWSIMDNFEWGSGYTVKFGLYQVNFTDPDRTRTAKKSAAYYKSVIKTRKV